MEKGKKRTREDEAYWTAVFWKCGVHNTHLEVQENCKMTVAKVSSVVLSEIIATNNECNNESAEIYLVLIIWNVISCSMQMPSSN